MKIENMDWYLKVIKNCISFGGRANRKEFIFVPMFIAFVINLFICFSSLLSSLLSESAGLIFLSALLLTLTIIFIATVVRRLHDINRSGWWWLIFLIPAVNLYAFGFLLLVGGKSGLNQYGSSPEDWVEQPPSLKTLFTLLAFSVFFGLFSRIMGEFEVFS